MLIQAVNSIRQKQISGKSMIDHANSMHVEKKRIENMIKNITFWNISSSFVRKILYVILQFE